MFYRERFVKGYFEGDLERIISIESSYEKTINSNDFLSTGYCAKGYKGTLCLECEVGYGVSTKFDCVGCGDIWDLFNKIIRLIFRIYVFWVSIQQAFRMNESLSKEFCDEVKENVNSAYYLKILTQHFQQFFSFIAYHLSIRRC